MTVCFSLPTWTRCASHAVTDSDRWVALVCWVPAASHPVVPSLSPPSDWQPTPSHTLGRMMFLASRSWPSTLSSAESRSLEILHPHQNASQLLIRYKNAFKLFTETRRWNSTPQPSPWSAVTLTFDLHKLIRSSVGAVNTACKFHPDSSSRSWGIWRMNEQTNAARKHNVFANIVGWLRHKT